MPKNKPTDPAFLAAARAFYGPAFAARTKNDLAAAMADWSEMDEDEQRFAVAHLHYLHLQAEAGTQRLLRRMIDVLEEVADSLADALEASAPVEDVDVPDTADLVAPDLDDEPETGLTDAQAHALARGLPVPEEDEFDEIPGDDDAGGEE